MKAIRAIFDLLDSAVGLALILLALFFLSRLISWIWYRIRPRGRMPLVINVTNGSRADANRDEMLSARLSAYVGEARAGLHIVVPGAGDAAGLAVAEEAPDSPAGWTALFRLALATTPAYRLDFTCELGTSFCRAAGQIVRVPGNRILASGVFEEKDDDDLIEAIGCFAIRNLWQRRSIRRRTPRWERWSGGEHSYRAYRRALDLERHDDFPGALRQYEKAMWREPVNHVIAVHHAALLELAGMYGEAVDAYRTANELWPEHIEIAYRFQATCHNWHDGGPSRLAEARDVLAAITRSLALPNLLRQWSRTLIPSRWNPGERRYWASWLRPILRRSGNKRCNYLTAIEVSKITIKLTGILEDKKSSDQKRRDGISQALEQLATLITKPSDVRAEVRLFHPERLGDEGLSRAPHAPNWYHPKIKEAERVLRDEDNDNYRSAKRDGIGWLAHYNAACFFSVALQIESPELLPDNFTLDDWQTDCTRAAVRELGHAARDPRNMLASEWRRRDPDLSPLRERLKGSRWARFADPPCEND